MYSYGPLGNPNHYGTQKVYSPQIYTQIYFLKLIIIHNFNASTIIIIIIIKIIIIFLIYLIYLLNITSKKIAPSVSCD